LAELAINIFRHLLTDQNASPANRLKAALEIVKLVESQRPHDRPTHLEVTVEEVKLDEIDSKPSSAKSHQRRIPSRSAATLLPLP